MTAMTAMTTVAGAPRKVSVAWRQRTVEVEYAWIAPERTAAPLVVFLHEGLGSVAMWKDFPQRLCETGDSGGWSSRALGMASPPRAGRTRCGVWTSCTSRRTKWCQPSWTPWV